jgi:hypothetical protein
MAVVPGGNVSLVQEVLSLRSSSVRGSKTANVAISVSNSQAVVVGSLIYGLPIG